MSDHPAASPEFWHDRWATNQLGFHEGAPNALLVRHWPSLDAGKRVLVPLCGKSHDMEWLAAQGHEVVGVELSPVACAAFFSERGLVPEVTRAGAFTRYRHGAITILQGDIFDLEGEYDALWDRAAMIALPGPVRERYVALVRAHVHGAMLIVAFVYDQAKRDGPPFSVPDDEVARLHPDVSFVTREPVDEERWRSIGKVENVAWRRSARSSRA